MLKTKLLSVILCFGIVLSLLFTPQRASAWTDIINGLWNGGQLVTDIMSFYDQYKAYADSVSKWVDKNVGATAIVASKVAALYTVQAVTRAIIGSGSNTDGGGVIGDWNNYLFVSPQQRAMAQMNSFFSTVSRGRLSSMNYEGVGPNYDAYLVSQAKKAIAGQPFSTNIQDISTNPKQMFDGGNMKGLMTYMQCANNVACYTLTSQNQYATTVAKEMQIADKSQDRGFLPVKKNGKIIQPASIVFGALSQVDQLGTQLIMSADPNSESRSAALSQIATGTTIGIAARSFQYTVGDKKQKTAVQNNNEKDPVFSFSYSSANGFGVKAK